MSYDPFIARIGGRRFLLTMLSCLTYVALLVGGYLDGSQFVTLQLATVATYIAGSGFQKSAEIKSNAPNPTVQTGGVLPEAPEDANHHSGRARARSVRRTL